MLFCVNEIAYYFQIIVWVEVCSSVAPWCVITILYDSRSLFLAFKLIKSVQVVEVVQNITREDNFIHTFITHFLIIIILEENIKFFAL